MIFIKLQEGLTVDLSSDPIFLHVLLNIMHITSYQQYILNIPIFQIQFFIGAKFIVQKLLHYCSIADRTFCHICQALPQTQTSHANVLSRHKIVLIKQRDLYASTANIHNSCTFFNDVLKRIFIGSNGFVTQIPLF